MGIDMEGYVVLYNSRVYQTLKIDLMNISGRPEEIGILKPEFLNVIVVNESGELRILQDIAEHFKFFKK